MKEVKYIKDHHVFIDHYHWLEAVPYYNMTARDVLAKCLQGRYHGLMLVEDDNIVGICVYEVRQDNAFIVGLYAKNQTDKFREQFFAKFKEMKFNKLSAVSMHDDDYFIRFSEFKRVFTFYEKEI